MSRVSIHEPENLDSLHSSIRAELGWDADSYAIAVEALILDKDSRVLLMRRGPGARDEVGKLEGVGGRYEAGSFRSEAMREIEEEIGAVEIEIVSLLEVKSDIVQDSNTAWIVLSFIARLISGTPAIMEPDKVDELLWLDPQTIPVDQLSSSCQQSIASLRDYLGSRPR